MKRLIAASLLICLFSTLQAQEPDYRHSLSLNFSGVFPQRFKVVGPQELFRKWLPGLEYRYKLTPRWQLRAGLRYRPPQTWLVGNLSSGFWSRSRSNSANLNLGAQLHFRKIDFLEDFRAYAFAELGLSRHDQDRQTFNRLATPQERVEHSIYRNISADLGLGVSYHWRQRWVVRFESAYTFTWVERELISGAETLPAYFQPIMNGDTMRFFGHTFLPITEVSVGWRF